MHEVEFQLKGLKFGTNTTFLPCFNDLDTDCLNNYQAVCVCKLSRMFYRKQTIRKHLTKCERCKSPQGEKRTEGDSPTQPPEAPEGRALEGHPRISPLLTMTTTPLCIAGCFPSFPILVSGC